MSKRVSLMVRFISFIVLMAAVLNGWWFIAIPLAIVGAWFFGTYVESIVAGIGFDALFGMDPTQGIAGYYGTIISVVIYASIAFVRSRIFS